MAADVHHIRIAVLRWNARGLSRFEVCPVPRRFGSAVRARRRLSGPRGKRVQSFLASLRRARGRVEPECRGISRLLRAFPPCAMRRSTTKRARISGVSGGGVCY